MLVKPVSMRASQVLVVVVVFALLVVAVVLLGKWFLRDASCQTPPCLMRPALIRKFRQSPPVRCW